MIMCRQQCTPHCKNCIYANYEQIIAMGTICQSPLIYCRKRKRSIFKEDPHYCKWFHCKNAKLFSNWIRISYHNWERYYEQEN